MGLAGGGQGLARLLSQQVTFPARVLEPPGSLPCRLAKVLPVMEGSHSAVLVLMGREGERFFQLTKQERLWLDVPIKSTCLPPSGALNPISSQSSVHFSCDLVCDILFVFPKSQGREVAVDAGP